MTMDANTERAAREQVRRSAEALIHLPEAEGKFSVAVQLIGLGVGADDARGLLKAAPRDPAVETLSESDQRFRKYVEAECKRRELTVAELQERLEESEWPMI